MLYTNTVNERVLELLKEVCGVAEFKSFYLAGGTALALQIGHRKSVDLDFFCPIPFDQKMIAESLIKNYNYQISGLAENTITGFCDAIKTDFLSHQYPLLKPNLNIDGVRLASLEDIASMKLNAIRNRGTKKDFVDLAFLLDHFDMRTILEFSSKKYPNHIDLMTLKSIIYFEDAELDPDCEMIKSLSWSEAKSKIQKAALPLI